MNLVQIVLLQSHTWNAHEIECLQGNPPDIVAKRSDSALVQWKDVDELSKSILLLRNHATDTVSYGLAGSLEHGGSSLLMSTTLRFVLDR